MVKREQISVPLDPELRECLERTAAKGRRRVKRLGRAQAPRAELLALSDTFFNDVGGAVSDIFASQGYKAEGEA
jgi:hypothetical protein